MRVSCSGNLHFAFPDFCVFKGQAFKTSPQKSTSGWLMLRNFPVPGKWARNLMAGHISVCSWVHRSQKQRGDDQVESADDGNLIQVPSAK